VSNTLRPPDSVGAKDPIREAVRQLRRLPGLGEKSAMRLVYFLLRAPPGTAKDIAAALAVLEAGVKECSICRDYVAAGSSPAEVAAGPSPPSPPGGQGAEPSTDEPWAESSTDRRQGGSPPDRRRASDPDDKTVCTLCAQTNRDVATVLVVEHPQDVAAFERAGEFRGRYHVLHGALSPLEGVTPDRLRVRELLDRMRDGVITEIILATDPDVEGDATALYLARLLEPLGVKVTRLAHGISVGTEIEYADALSLARALQNRVEVIRAGAP